MAPDSTDHSSDSAASGHAVIDAPDDVEARTLFELARPWQRATGARQANALTCDVEDYFQVSAFEHLVPKSRWDGMQCRIPQNVDRVLQLLADADVVCTFFTLGWVAERFPDVVKRIAGEGHEIASHGMRHHRVWTQTPEQFRQDVTAAKRLLEDAGGQRVKGYRAASWSFDQRTPWAHSILREAGYEYSSSIYPIAHDHYGMPNASTQPYYSCSDVLEIPPATVRLAGRNWPAAGGGYFRLLPLGVSLWLLRRSNRLYGNPAVFYFHPWELDPEQPKMAGAGRRARFRHYVNLDKFEARFRVLLGSFEWGRMDSLFLCRSSSEVHDGTTAGREPTI